MEHKETNHTEKQKTESIEMENLEDIDDLDDTSFYYNYLLYRKNVYLCVILKIG